MKMTDRFVRQCILIVAGGSRSDITLHLPAQQPPVAIPVIELILQ